MGKKNSKRIKKGIRCEMTGKIIKPTDEVILVSEAISYVRKLGYLVSNLKFLIIFTMLILTLTLITGAECTSTPVEDCTLNANTYYELDGATYYLNDTNGNGALRGNGNNYVLNCNGSTFIGDNTLNSIFMYASSRSNVTIKNCNIRNYHQGIKFYNSENNTVENCDLRDNSNIAVYYKKSSRGKVINSNFTNSTYGDIIFDTSDIEDVYIFNNTFKSNSTYSIYYSQGGYSFDNFTIYLNNFTNVYRTIHMKNGSNINFTQNYLNNIEYKGFVFQLTNGIDFYDNTILNTPNLDRGANIADCNNFTIINNLVVNYSVFGNFVNGDNIKLIDNIFQNASSKYGVYFKNGSNINVTNNSFNINDRGIFFEKGNSTNVWIEYNLINNSHMHYDVWDSGISIANDRDVYFKHKNFNINHNTFNNFGCNGIVIRDMDGIIIKNNTFSQDYNYLFSKSFNCKNEPISAIFFKLLYKGYHPVGTLTNDSYSVLTNHSCNNITIANNTYNDVYVKLRTQGATNINHDLENYWTKTFQLPYLMDREYFYINNLYDELRTINLQNEWTTNFYQGINTNWSINYTISKENLYFKNINKFNLEINLFDVTNPKVYQATLIEGTRLTNTYANVTLAPNNEINIDTNG